jgi:zona occludens toxin
VISLFLGASGGGKSYEAVVFHVLPALRAGRLVITNLPLVVDAIESLVPRARELIEFRLKSKGPDRKASDGGTSPCPVFGHVSDYGSPWRDESGHGPLYVIDECHKALPRVGTPRAVSEWFAEHRHENADVILITQSHGKVDSAITENVQIVYRCRKAVAFGSMDRYIRKVQDGIRGDVVNTAIRVYDAKYFGLYKSHTRGQAARELAAQDIVPFWRRWPVIGAGLCFVVLGGMLLTIEFKNPFHVNTYAKAVPVTRSALASPASAPASATPGAHPLDAPPAPRSVPPVVSSGRGRPASVDPDDDDVLPEPYAGRGIHLVGHMQAGPRHVWQFSVSQNGTRIAHLTDADLERAGYRWVGSHECGGYLVWRDSVRAVICDAPQVSLGPVVAQQFRKAEEPQQLPGPISLGGSPVRSPAPASQ